MKIIPGVLETSFKEISNNVESVSEYVDTIHIDVCDGQFVPSKTWPYNGMITGKIDQDYQIKQLINEDDGLPEWEKLDYQFDLMIKDPWHTIETWGRIGASTVVLHYAAFPSVEKFVETYELAQGFMLDVGLATTYDEYIKLKPQIFEIFDKGIIKFFQPMTIKQIGVQGQLFDDRWLTEIEEIRKQYSGLLIQADGGVSEKSLIKLQHLHVNQVVIGSGIFAEGNAGENVEFFNDIIRQ
jgi:pentose-5-phosphate-3-epimerase